MLEKPDLDDKRIVASLERHFGVRVASISFLPLGADLNTAVYHAATAGRKRYFVKLRRGNVARAGVAVPSYLATHGFAHVIPPIPTKTGQLWATLPPFKVILTPYVEGQNGFEAKMTGRQWEHFGAALKQFHTATLPQEITKGIPRETFSPHWRETVRTYLSYLDQQTFAEPVAAEMAAFLGAKSQQTLALVRRAERLARTLQAHPLEFILCHGDIHLWNLLLDPAGHLYLVDWDTLIFAPIERDLIFVGAGLGDSGFTPAEEEAHFYRGYGPTNVNPSAIAYYRCERIVEDIVIFCEQILMSSKDSADRRQALAHLKSNYRPGGTVDVATHSNPPAHPPDPFPGN